MDITINAIDLFFTPPATPDLAVGRVHYSTLYLLRRDVNFCFGVENATGQRSSSAGAALFPGAMAVMTGIDLLAKCWRGNEAIGKTGSRFKGFLMKYFGLDQALAKEHAEAIYQLRNGLHHAFGLSSRSKKREYQFVLSENQQELIRIVHRNVLLWTIWIDVRVLRQRFEEAIERYQGDLKSDADLQKKFIPMFKRYGVIVVDRPGQPWFGPLIVP